MSQAPLVFTGTSGQDLINFVEAALQANVSFNAGATEPTTKYAYQFWADTSLGLLKQRNAANSAWIVLGTLGVTGLNIGHTVGQCQLTYTNSAALTLIPYNGDKIKINGSIYQIPSGGVVLGNAGLTASILYYAYIYDNAGTLTLEASTTAPAVDTTAGNVGVKIKTGDSTRSLVGVVYMGPGAPGTFVDSASQRFVCSWFNQPVRQLWLPLPGIGTFTTTGVAAEINSAFRIEWVEFGRPTTIGIAGIGLNTASNAIVECAVKVDATTGQDSALVGGHVAASFQTGITSWVSLGFGPGYHYATTVGVVSSGVGSIVGSNSSIHALLGAT